VFWGWEAMGRRGKERGGGEELVLVLTHYREVSWWPDFVRDGEDDALRHGELLEPVLLGIMGMCAGEKGYFRDSQARSLPMGSLYFCVELP